MKIFVHLKDKLFTINCGEGAQSIRWLGDVAIFRYSSEQYAMQIGITYGMRLENGSTMDINTAINEVLQDHQHVWLLTKDDLENIEAKKKRRKRRRKGKKGRPIRRKKN